MLKSNSTHIKIDTTPDCVNIIISRTEKANAMTVAMVNALSEIIEHEWNRPLVIKSHHPNIFCAGADIQEFLQGADHLAQQGKALIRLVSAISKNTAPLIACVNGKAAGIGFMIVALSDVVIAKSDATLIAPEIEFGMYPIAVDVVLRSRIGSALSSSLCASGRGLTTDAALRLGLITKKAESFQDMQNSLEFYLQRLAALKTLCSSRLLDPSRLELPNQLALAIPAMHENFSDPDVPRRTSEYIRNIKSRIDQ